MKSVDFVSPDAYLSTDPIIAEPQLQSQLKQQKVPKVLAESQTTKVSPGRQIESPYTDIFNVPPVKRRTRQQGNKVSIVLSKVGGVRGDVVKRQSFKLLQDQYSTQNSQTSTESLMQHISLQ